jgi:hypothetical protein
MFRRLVGRERIGKRLEMNLGAEIFAVFHVQWDRVRLN